jgi:hypothetical protein
MRTGIHKRCDKKRTDDVDRTAVHPGDVWSASRVVTLLTSETLRITPTAPVFPGEGVNIAGSHQYVLWRLQVYLIQKRLVSMVAVGV